MRIVPCFRFLTGPLEKQAATEVAEYTCYSVQQESLADDSIRKDVLLCKALCL